MQHFSQFTRVPEKMKIGLLQENCVQIVRINLIGPVKQTFSAQNCDYFLIHQVKHVF